MKQNNIWNLGLSIICRIIFFFFVDHEKYNNDNSNKQTGQEKWFHSTWEKNFKKENKQKF